MPQRLLTIKQKQMKKLVLSICALALVATSMTSCKKIRTCECTFTGSPVTGTFSVDSDEKMTKKAAKDDCESDNGTVGTQTVSCKLK